MSSTVFQKARSPMHKLFGFLLAPLLICSSLFASSSKEGWGVSIPPEMFQEDLFYSTETEGKIVKSVWKVRVEPNAIVARAEKGKNSTEAIFSKSLNLYRFVDIDETTETTIKREGSKLIATVKNKMTGKETKKENKIGKSHWIQEFTVGMKGFLLSKDKSCEFYVLHIDDLSVREMIARKEGTKTIQLGDRSVRAEKVSITLPGIQSWFWGAEAWYDLESHDLLLYKANSGPGTPMSTVTFSSKTSGVAAKVALEPKFDDFASLLGSFVNWHTLEGSQFMNGPSKWQKRELWPKWNFATISSI